MELEICNSINIYATLRNVLLLLGYNLELGASQYLQEAPSFIHKCVTMILLKIMYRLSENWQLQELRDDCSAILRK